MVLAVGGAQISVNGGGDGTWRTEKSYCFFHILWLFIGKIHDLSLKKIQIFWSETKQYITYESKNQH
jgi:hypothetical protein